MKTVEHVYEAHGTQSAPARIGGLVAFLKEPAIDDIVRRKVSLVSVAESLDTGSAAGRLVINIMTAVSQWERKRSGNGPAMRCATSGRSENGSAILPMGID